MATVSNPNERAFSFWYIKNYGPEVNLFVDHSQIVELEALRSGIWGTKSLWGRVLTIRNNARVMGGKHDNEDRSRGAGNFPPASRMIQSRVFAE